MAGIFNAMGFGWGGPGNGNHGRDDGSGTADGGKVSRLDQLFDAAGPLNQPISAKARAEFARQKAAEAKFMPPDYDPQMQDEVHRLRLQECKDEQAAKEQDQRRASKHWGVTPASRFGGTGLYQGKKD